MVATRTTRRRTTDRETPVGEIIITLESEERHFAYENLGVSFESTPAEILEAVAPLILESDGIDLREEQDEGVYTLKKVESSGNIYLFPKSTAGL